MLMSRLFAFPVLRIAQTRLLIAAIIGILTIATGQNLHRKVLLLLAIDPSVSFARYLPNVHSYSHATWCIGSWGMQPQNVREYGYDSLNRNKWLQDGSY